MKRSITELPIKRCWKKNCLTFIFLLTVMVWLTACPAVGPDYVRPETPQPENWHAPLEDGLRAAAPDPQMLATWWNSLNDPLLADLMVRAVRGNLDLQTAQARVREARARRGIHQADYYPSADALGSAAYTRTSESTGKGEKTNLYEAAFDSRWELDVFGGVRRSVEAADADLAASRDDRNNVLISMLAEVALNYIDVRTLQARLAVAEANLKAQEDTYQLTRSRFEAGLSDELAVKSALTTLAGTRAQIPLLKIDLEGAKNRLAVLLGETPGSLHPTLALAQPIPVPPVSVAVGVPAETLRQRPDVRRAERLLAAQTARIGVATADLYPKFRLFGTIGYQSLSAGDFVDPVNQFWQIGPSVTWALFAGGAIRQNIEVQSALQEQALKQYQATILIALEEAENAMVAYAGEQQRRDALVIAQDAASQAFHLALNQYQAGLVDFSDVLIAQRSLLSYQDQLVLSQGTVTKDLVRLYKALGGGWPALAAAGPATDAPPPKG